MNDVAAALKLSKGGLYHHFQSKDEILFHIMSHAMDITEERVINVARRVGGTGLEGAEERLRTLIRLHIQVVLSPKDREITVMLHENHPLPLAFRRKINARKKGITCTSSRILSPMFIASAARRCPKLGSSHRVLPRSLCSA
jgi:AcrR family transcriptional regulator